MAELDRSNEAAPKSAVRSLPDAGETLKMPTRVTLFLRSAAWVTVVAAVVLYLIFSPA